MIQYPSQLGLVMRLVVALLSGRRLSFADEGRRFIKRLKPPLEVLGRENIPAAGPCIVTLNHYSRPGFRIWWAALAISAVLPGEAHWTMTAALTFPGDWRAAILMPASSYLLPKIAGIFSMTPMPPMPPRPQDVAARAQAIRTILRYASLHPQALLCLAPEGGDAPGGILQMPASGAGRLILHISGLGFDVVPVGVYETRTAFRIHFGECYSLQPLLQPGDPLLGDVRSQRSPQTSLKELDQAAARIVMSRIARLLPEAMRGEFSSGPPGQEDPL